MRYQFHIDKKPAAPIRATIHEAAADAIDTGYAGADRFGRVVLHNEADIVEYVAEQTRDGKMVH